MLGDVRAVKSGSNALAIIVNTAKINEPIETGGVDRLSCRQTHGEITVLRRLRFARIIKRYFE